MQFTNDGNRLRSVSFHGFWVGAVLLTVGVCFFLKAFPAALNMHNKTPNEGAVAFLFSVLCLVAGLLCSIVSAVSGFLARAKHGQSGPWPVLAAIAPLMAVFSIVIVVAAIVGGWF